MFNLRVFTTLAVGLLLVGCAAQENDKAIDDVSSPDVWSSMSLTAIMQRTYHADYDPIASPELAADGADVVVKGRIISVRDGRSVSLAGDAPDHYVTFAIKPEQVLREDPNRVGDLVYFELPRPDNLGADVFSNSIPSGLQVTLFGYRVDESVGTVTVGDDGREPGSTLYRSGAQGLFTQAAGRRLESVLEPLSEMGPQWRKLGSMHALLGALN